MDLKERAIERKIKRRQVILTEDEVCRHYTFVADGCFKVFQIDKKGVEHLVKWTFAPRDGVKELTPAEMKAAPHDFLEKNLIDRTKKGPAVWDMVVYVGEPGDPQDNPTIAWPENRKHFKAGTLTLSSATAQKGAACEKINFDPLIMTDGIGPTNDPILLFRSPAYAVSFAKRLTGQ